MKKILTTLLIVLFLSASLVAWMVLGSGTAFKEQERFFIIAEDGNNKAALLDTLSGSGILKSTQVFSFTASATGLWDRLKPGKYAVQKGQSLLDIVRMLKNGKQAEIKLVINRLRTREGLSRLIARNFSSDSVEVMRFLSSNDSLRNFGVDTNTVFTTILPDTYTLYWNTPLRSIFKRLHTTSEGFWKRKERLQKAEKLGYSADEVYTLASIVQEESNLASDQSLVASVYLNRLRKGMPLQADPTIRYAMKDFTSNRVYYKQLSFPSPYNTYRNKGLPPGPICTPLPATIDVVLNAPKTDYLFFVAHSDFNGTHRFSSNYAQHQQFAKEYQIALDAYMLKKQTQNQPQP